MSKSNKLVNLLFPSYFQTETKKKQLDIRHELTSIEVQNFGVSKKMGLIGVYKMQTFLDIYQNNAKIKYEMLNIKLSKIYLNNRPIR